MDLTRWFIIIMSLVGILIFGVFLHELTHQIDFKLNGCDVEDTCYLHLRNGWNIGGMVEANCPNSLLNENPDYMFWFEFRGYTIQIIFSLVALFLWFKYVREEYNDYLMLMECEYDE